MTLPLKRWLVALIGLTLVGSGVAVAFTSTAAHAAGCPTVDTGPVYGVEGCPIFLQVNPTTHTFLAIVPDGAAFGSVDLTGPSALVVSEIFPTYGVALVTPTHKQVFVSGFVLGFVFADSSAAGTTAVVGVPLGAAVVSSGPGLTSAVVYTPAALVDAHSSGGDSSVVASPSSGGYVGVTSNEGVVGCAHGSYDPSENSETTEDPHDPGYENEPNTIVGIPPSGPPTVPSSCMP